MEDNYRHVLMEEIKPELECEKLDCAATFGKMLAEFQKQLDKGLLPSIIYENVYAPYIIHNGAAAMWKLNPEMVKSNLRIKI